MDTGATVAWMKVTIAGDCAQTTVAVTAGVWCQPTAHEITGRMVHEMVRTCRLDTPVTVAVISPVISRSRASRADSVHAERVGDSD